MLFRANDQPLIRIRTGLLILTDTLLSHCVLVAEAVGCYCAQIACRESTAEREDQVCRDPAAAVPQQRMLLLGRAVAGEQRRAGCEAAHRALL